ncbi:uncharacterized protein KRP23_5146 [Phytophthora ramorum]|uniref:uncharacterized protein n=1 Tax=Phytophthora ramorum TaxID=164328 RepID=UPI0030B1D184|nr:hypothetical protein KRP23_5146 [Phytophthora ramorum]KAH7504568.1 hypothetical protein KRP22_5058 [Phytophthora ramorum]
MAFLAEDDDAMRAFEAVLSFVDDFAVEESSSEDAVNNDLSTVQLPVANRSEMPSDGAPDHESDSPAGVIVDPAENSRRRPCRTLAGPSLLNGNEVAARPVSEAIKSRRRAADNARKRMLRKAGVYGDPNRARNERKLEIAYLREKVGQLEAALQNVQERPVDATAKRTIPVSRETGHCASASTESTEVQVSSIWEGFAARQRTRREKAERENIRLKLVLEGQIKVAKSLEILLVKRAQQQVRALLCASIRGIFVESVCDLIR